MARKPCPAQTWAFLWPCPYCKTDRKFMVNEILWRRDDPVARCPTCTRLITVTAEHRMKMIDVKRHGVE